MTVNSPGCKDLRPMSFMLALIAMNPTTCILQSLLVFITGAFLILAYCADKHGSQNFQEVIREVLGPGAYIATQIVILLYMFGSTIAYMILIGDQLQSGM